MKHIVTMRTRSSRRRQEEAIRIMKSKAWLKKTWKEENEARKRHVELLHKQAMESFRRKLREGTIFGGTPTCLWT